MPSGIKKVTRDDDEVKVELESEGEAGSGTHLVISDGEAKNKKKKINFRRSKVAQLDKIKEAPKTETRSMNNRN